MSESCRCLETPMHAVCFQGGNHWVQISFSLINCYKKANILILVKWDLL